MGGVEDTFVKYWDEAATVAVMEFKVQKSVKQQEGSDGVATKKEKERKKKSSHIHYYYLCYTSHIPSRRCNNVYSNS